MSEEDKLLYSNLIKFWLQSRNQQQPYGAPIQQYKDTPAYFLNPNDMATVMNAQTPYDLYNKPTNMPFQTNYPTIAYNQGGSPDQMGVSRGTVMMSTQPSTWQSLRSWDELASKYPENYPKELVPQGVYEHEAGHTMDPRFLPPQNRGYLKRWGLEGSVANREAPALQAEQDYWDSVRGK